MLKSRKIIAVVLAFLLTVSALSCFVSAAPDEYATLPEGYLVINDDWTGKIQSEKFEYVLGGETYLLEYNVTAFDTLEAATAVWLPEGIERTIVLAPGTYSDAMTLTTDINLCGPYFGKNPNNNPNSPDYDPTKEDWALHNGRSLDPEKEAVFTAKINIAAGCNNLTIDGIALTGAAQITDTSRTNENIAVNYNFKNLYFEACTASSLVHIYTAASINRYAYFDNIRMTNCGACTKPVMYRCEDFEFNNSYIYNFSMGTSTNVQFYLYANNPSTVLTPYTTLRNSFSNNRFENIGGTNFLNFAARASACPGIDSRSSVILEVYNNDFINVATNGRCIQDQISYDEQELYVVGNRFIMKQPNSGITPSAMGVYYDGVGDAPHHVACVIEKNYVEGYSDGNTFIGQSSAKYSNIGPNYFSDGAGGQKTITPNTNTTIAPGEVYDDTLKYSSADFDILNSNIGAVSFTGTGTSRTAILYLVDSAVPTFKFKDTEVTYGVYSDVACSNTLTNAPANGDKIYVKAVDGPYTCTYTINVSSALSSKTDLFAYGDGVVLNYYTNRININEKDGDGVFDFPTADEIDVVTGATCAVYATADCSGNPITRIAILDTLTVAYLKITAPDGSYEIYPINIFGVPSEGGVNLGASSQCSLLKLIVPGADVTKSGNGYAVEAKDGVKSIQPQLIVSSKATFDFYMDATCKHSAGDNNNIKLNALNSIFYVRVIAEDGTESDVIPVTVTSKRSVAKYSDSAIIPAYARSAVNYLNNNGYGIFGGDEKGALNPRNNITRYELAKVMVTLAGLNVEMSEDVQLNRVFDDFYTIQGEASWAIPYVRTAYAAGLINGVSDGKGNTVFDGKAYTTREQFATVFMRFVAAANGTTVKSMYKKNAAKADAAFKSYADKGAVSNWALNEVKLATYFGYVQGDGYGFNPKNNIIRADIAVILHNYVK